MPNFSGPEGDLTEIYLSEPDILERYVGNQLWTWGYNFYGQLGTNNIVHRSSPVQTVSGGTNWKQVSCGIAHTAAIKTDGTLWLWGDNGNGRLGDNTTIDKSSPVQTVSGGTNWKQVSAGGDFTAAIKTDGTLWLWGNNGNGRLGDNTITSKSSPVQTSSAGTNWKQVACGYSFTAAIKTDGTLWLWGDNSVGQLGDSTRTHRSIPLQTISGVWKQVSAISASDYIAAIKTDGTLWLWGLNTSGQLGDNTTVSKSSPVQTVAGGTNWKQVGCGWAHIAAIKTDGTLWTWGYNSNGQLGNNDSGILSANLRSSPVQTIAGGTNWKQVAGGRYHTAAIKTDGTLWTWGFNSNGQLGINDIVHRSSPIQIIGGGTNWKQVGCGELSTLAITYTES
jgi:alpha-tubulin suppressor-like RCC1 family protein